MSISIHAAREGGDGICPDCYRKMKISIHAAREGGDLDKKIDWTDFLEFQSTPPVKAATTAPVRATS